MTFFNINSIFSRRIKKSVKKSFLAIATLGLILPTVSTLQVSRAEASSNPSKNSSGAPSSRTVLEDGTYLFGQSPQPDQIGSAYAVLSVQNNQTIGAFYYPHSSFDCFSGQVLPDRLAVNVVDSYDQVSYPYEVALSVSDDSLVAGSAAPAYTLEGFHQINELSTQDLEMLAVCKSDFAQ
ncbi:MAG: hypothetical protein AAFZ17_13330 [Cyanobacteria bacterium J06650_10]